MIEFWMEDVKMMPKDLMIAEIAEVGVYKISVGGVVYFKFLRMRKRRHGPVSYYDREITQAQALRIKKRILDLGGGKDEAGYRVRYARKIGQRRWQAL